MLRNETLPFSAHSSWKATDVNMMLLLRGAGGRAGLLIWASPSLSSPFCASDTCCFMQSLLTIQHPHRNDSGSDSRQLLICIFLVHKNFFWWQKWLDQTFCSPASLSHLQSLAAHPSSHHCLSRVCPNAYLAAQRTRSRVKKQKNPKLVGLYFTQINSPSSSQCSTQT